MIIDTAELDATEAYKLLIGSIVPRAIAWVSTVSTDGVANLAPISFFTAVGRRPPMVSLTMQPRSTGELKDTFTNIRDTGEFVTNLVSCPRPTRCTAPPTSSPPRWTSSRPSDSPRHPRRSWRPPGPRCPIHFECRVDRIIPVGDLDDHVVGVVERVHLRDDLYLDRGRVDTAALVPVGRLAAEYTLVENVFTTPLDDAVLRGRGGRMRRLDEHDTTFSPIETDAWSPSGSVRTEG